MLLHMKTGVINIALWDVAPIGACVTVGAPQITTDRIVLGYASMTWFSVVPEMHFELWRDSVAPQCLNAFIMGVTIPVNSFVPLLVEELFRLGVTDSHRRVF